MLHILCGWLSVVSQGGVSVLMFSYCLKNQAGLLSGCMRTKVSLLFLAHRGQLGDIWTNTSCSVPASVLTKADALKKADKI